MYSSSPGVKELRSGNPGGPLQTEDWLITHILKDREKINRKVSQLGKTGGLDWRSGHMSLLSRFALWTSDKLTNDTFIPFLKRFHILFVL